MDVLALGLTGDGALRAAAVADREVTRMEGVRLDHLAQYLGEVADAWEPPAWQRRGAEQAIQLGGSGTPLVPEFAVCEVAAALGLTQPAATSMCADVLDLAYRLRGIAQSVRSGHLAFARARLIARRTRDLPLEQALLVEERLCRLRDTEAGPMAMVARVPMSRLRTVVDQAVVTIRGPETEQEACERVAESLYVAVSAAEPGAVDVSARLAAADGVRLDRRLDEVAGWLAQIGDERPKAILRAVALGLLADPRLLTALDQLRRERTAAASRGGCESAGAAESPGSAHGAGSARSAGSAESASGAESPGGAASPEYLESPAAAESMGPTGDAGDLRGLAPRGMPLESSPEPSDRAGPRADLGPPPHPEPSSPEEAPPEHAPVPIAAGASGCPPALLEKFATLTSTVLYLHLDRASGTWSEERAGVLTREQARALVGHSNVTIRPVLDLAEPLTYTGYVAPPRLKEQLALLNAGYCTFPGCHRRARAGEVDHRIPHSEQGPTSSRNTHRLCRKHHRAKDKGGWRVVAPIPGIWLWTSPAGAVYLVAGSTTTQLNGSTSPLASATPRPDGPRAAASFSSSSTFNSRSDEVSAPAKQPSAARGSAPDGECDRSDLHRTRSYQPPWDPWQDPDPLTRDEHEVTYALVNAW